MHKAGHIYLFQSELLNANTHKSQENLLGEGESGELNMEARALYSYGQV